MCFNCLFNQNGSEATADCDFRLETESEMPPGLDGRNVCSQEHISVITNNFSDSYPFIIQFQHKRYLNYWLYLYLSRLRPAIIARA